MFTYLGKSESRYSLVSRLNELKMELPDDLPKIRNVASPVDNTEDFEKYKNVDTSLKGGEHAFHGWQMVPDEMSKYFGKKTGPHFGTEGAAVTSGEIKHAYNYIKKFEPDVLYVYSRGSAVWAKTQEAHPDVLDYVGKVNYLAPAKLRTSWAAQDVELANKTGEVFAAAQDGLIPIRQAAEIAKDIGQDKIKIVDVNPRVEFSNEKFGKNGHSSARYPIWHLQTKEVPVDQIDDRFPDWGGTGSASTEDLKKQMIAAKEVGGFDSLSGLEERAFRTAVCNMLLENASIADDNIVALMKHLDLIIAVDSAQADVYLYHRNDWDFEYGEASNPQDKIGAIETQIVQDDIYEVKWATVDEAFRKKGIGRIMYNVVIAALTLYHNSWAMCDRSEVSTKAQRIWHTIAKMPDIYEIEQMDHPIPDEDQWEEGEDYDPDVDYFLTRDESDDVPMWSHNEFYWSGEKTADVPEMKDQYGFDKDWWYFWDPQYKEEFLESGMTKRFKMKDAKGFLDILEENELLVWY